MNRTVVDSPPVQPSALADVRLSSRPTRVIIFGLTPLAVAVARRLKDNDTDVTVVPDTAADGSLADELRELDVEVARSHRRRDAALAAHLTEGTNLLALADDPVENLKTAVAAHDLRPETEVVIQTFDRAFADRLEQEGLTLEGDDDTAHDRLYVRRAYNEAALAAPFFAARALQSENLWTTRFGEEHILLLRLSVGPRSSLLGRSPADITRHLECHVLGRRDPSAAWRVADDKAPLVTDEEIIVGGIQEDVLRLAAKNARRSRRPVAQGLSDSGGRLASRAGGARSAVRDAIRRRTAVPALVLVGLTAFLALTVAIFAMAGNWDRPIEWPYNAVRTALGEQHFGPPEVEESETALRLLGTIALLLGGALLAIVFAQFAAVATKRRVDPESGAQQLAGNLRGHIVVGGVGELGYRIARALDGAGIDTVVISPSADDRFMGAVQSFAPVLVGDIRLEENLARAGVNRARAFIACAPDNFANVEACIRAERMSRDNGRELLSVARVFHDTYAEQAARGFGIDHLLGAAEVAASAFVDAALDPWAATRFQSDGFDLMCARVSLDGRLTSEQVEAWRQQGVRLLAFRDVRRDRRNGSLSLGALLAFTGRPVAEDPNLTELPAVESSRRLPKKGLESGHSVLIVGPEAAVETVLAVEPDHVVHPGLLGG
jgi:voltage-gated potassium channel Kch